MNNNRLALSLVKIGAPLPDWSLDKIFEEKVPTKENYLGKPLLVLFFSLGCPGCLGRAIPYANRVVYENGDKMNVLGIHTNFDSVDYPQEKFQKAKDELFIRFPFFKDHNFDTTFLNYGAGGTPHWFFIDEKGIVQYSIFGSDPNNALLRLDYVINEYFVKQKNKIMSITERLLSFLGKNETANTDETPEGFCPNCWGRAEYGGKFYEAVKNNKVNVNDKSQNVGWIQDYADKHLLEIQLKKEGEATVCQKCKITYRPA